jgi:hypothetical protein
MGLSLEQVDILYRNSTILGSNQFRKQILAENMVRLPRLLLLPQHSFVPPPCLDTFCSLAWGFFFFTV